MIDFIVFGCIAVLAGVLLGLDWWLAGRTSRRSLVRARDGGTGNAEVEYNLIQRRSQSQGGPGL